jgi:hypothetical protein
MSPPVLVGLLGPEFVEAAGVDVRLSVRLPAEFGRRLVAPLFDLHGLDGMVFAGSHAAKDPTVNCVVSNGAWDRYAQLWR